MCLTASYRWCHQTTLFALLLTDIGPLLGGRIHSQLEKEVVPSLDGALRMAGGNMDTTPLAFTVLNLLSPFNALKFPSL